MIYRHQVGPQQLVLRAVVIVTPPPDRCYACDARAIGTCDRRWQSGRIEAACVRHADTFNGTRGAS